MKEFDPETIKAGTSPFHDTSPLEGDELRCLDFCIDHLNRCKVLSFYDDVCCDDLRWEELFGALLAASNYLWRVEIDEINRIVDREERMERLRDYEIRRYGEEL